MRNINESCSWWRNTAGGAILWTRSSRVCKFHELYLRPLNRHANLGSMVSMELTLLPYEPAFLNAFIEWRHQPLSVRHNPLKAMSVEEIARMLASESTDLSQLAL